MKKECGEICASFPGYKYYADAACAVVENCCVGYEFNDKTNAELGPSCRLLAGATAVVKETGATAGYCYARILKVDDNSKPRAW